MQFLDAEITILGAGVAGLAAAQALRDAGFAPVVLEARQRVGGRVWTDRTWAPVELGAEFIHGRNAATWRYIRAANLTTRPWGTGRLFAQRGQVVSDEEGLPARTLELFEAVQAYDGPDCSVAEVLAALAHEGDQPAVAMVERWLANIESADVSRLSARLLSEERRMSTAGGDNFHIVEGYDRVPQQMATGLDIRLDHAVTAIKWDETGAQLTLADGRLWHTRRVVVTVPLGVLQAGQPAFDPPLPLDKEAAIAALAMGQVSKLVLWFERMVWPPFGIMSTDGRIATWWPVGSREAPALMGYTGGPAALTLAQLGEAGAIESGLADLETLFGPVIRQNFRGGRLADWSTDPWSLGAYTYSPVGSSHARATLAAPVAGTLFFAGEATSTNGHVATVHGAIETGWRVAEEVIAVTP